jgi:hypothetical protein
MGGRGVEDGGRTCQLLTSAVSCLNTLKPHTATLKGVYVTLDVRCIRIGAWVGEEEEDEEEEKEGEGERIWLLVLGQAQVGL